MGKEFRHESRRETGGLDPKVCSLALGMEEGVREEEGYKTKEKSSRSTPVVWRDGAVALSFRGLQTTGFPRQVFRVMTHDHSFFPATKKRWGINTPAWPWAIRVEPLGILEKILLPKVRYMQSRAQPRTSNLPWCAPVKGSTDRNGPTLYAQCLPIAVGKFGKSFKMATVQDVLAITRPQNTFI